MRKRKGVNMLAPTNMRGSALRTKHGPRTLMKTSMKKVPSAFPRRKHPRGSY